MPREFVTTGSHRSLLRYGVCLLSVVIAAVLAVPAFHYLSPIVFLPFLTAAIVSAWFGGFWQGVLATVLSTATIVLVAPDGWINTGPRLSERLAVFFVIAIVVSWLSAAYGRGKDAVRARESWFQEIFEASRDAIFLVETSARFVEVNRAACELTGYSHEELLSMSVPDLHDEADLHAFEQHFDSIMDGQDVISKALIRRKDGTKVPVEFSNRRMKFREKSVMHTSARDVTQRTRAEAALKTSEERYRDLFENANDIIFAHDLDGRYTAVNKSGERITGYSREESLGLNLSEIMGPEHLKRARQMISKKLSGEETTAYELEVVAKNGRKLALEVTSRLIMEGDTPVGVQGIARDITERKRAEEALSESEQRYRAVAETASDAIITIDQQSTILFVNIAAENIFGYTVAEMLGKQLTMLMPGSLRHIHASAVQRYVKTGQRNRSWKGIELPGLHKSGREIPLEISFSEFNRHHQPFFTAVVRDITERKQAEDKLKARERQLAAAQLSLAHDMSASVST